MSALFLRLAAGVLGIQVKGIQENTRAFAAKAVKRLLTIATAGAMVAWGGTELAAGSRPDANFGFFPRGPESGQTVRFVSYACDPDGKLVEQAWDLDADGSFDDARGAKASTTFPPGRHRVTLRVANRQGVTATRSRIVDVELGSRYTDPWLSNSPPLLSPFPVVRLSGSVTGALTRITVLSVRAPVCSRATVLCKGDECPFRRSSKLTGRGAARFPAVQRSLPAGSTVTVVVTKRDRIGKLTRFRFRANRSPKRLDRCVRFGSTRGISCPLN